MSDAQMPGALDQEAYRRALEEILAALEEIREGISEPVTATSDTVLIGDGGLESLAFVTFTVALDERLQGAGWPVSAIDLLPHDVDTLTVAQLAERICGMVASRVT